MHKLPNCLAAGQYLPVLESAAWCLSVGIIWPTSANKFHRGLLQSAARSVEQTIPAGIHICLGRRVCVCGCLCLRVALLKVGPPGQIVPWRRSSAIALKLCRPMQNSKNFNLDCIISNSDGLCLCSFLLYMLNYNYIYITFLHTFCCFIYRGILMSQLVISMAEEALL